MPKFTSQNTHPEVFRFDTEKAGPHLLILGAIHGNESCGPKAIFPFMDAINNGDIVLSHGAITCVPICNPKGYELGQREVEANLNRILVDAVCEPDAYEESLKPALLAAIRDCDMLLDLHAYRGDTPPFIMQDIETPACQDWAQAIGFETIITGWMDLYPDGGDSNSYAHAHGKMALTVECGNVTDPNGAAYATQAIYRTLAHFNMIEAMPDHAEAYTPDALETVKMAELIMRPKDEASRLNPDQDWRHLAPFTKGDTLTFLGDQPDMIAAFDGVLVMPKPTAQPGGEWFYTAQIQPEKQPANQSVNQITEPLSANDRRLRRR